MDQYMLNTDGTIPIYQQILDSIYADIKNGKLPSGTKLATVRELANQLHVACGTVKRAYDELSKLGVVEMTQGRGTYVRYLPKNSDSRKEQAMAAIESMLDQLEALKLSPVEMSIFIDLKLRERAQQKQAVRVALVECNPEILFQLTKRLRRYDNIDVYSYVLDELMAYPYKIGEETDLIVTSAVHAKALEEAVSEKGKIVKVALSTVPGAVLKIAMLKPNRRIGILAKSRRFAEMMQELCQNYARQAEVAQPYLFDSAEDCGVYLQGMDAVVVPEDYNRFCGQKDADLLKDFEKSHDLLTCAYQIDQGSFIYLEERLNELLKKKEI